jgi:CheY-like chemotaxis protein
MSTDNVTTGNRIVLVVDDDPDIREAYVTVLESAGYVVREAGDGREALDVLVTMPRPCMILLDLMMPRMDGVQFLDAARTDDQIMAIPVVVVSAYSQHFGALVDRVAGVLKKPFRADALLDRVRDTCGSAT